MQDTDDDDEDIDGEPLESHELEALYTRADQIPMGPPTGTDATIPDSGGARKTVGRASSTTQPSNIDLNMEKPIPIPEDFDTVGEWQRLTAERAVYGHGLEGHPELVRAGCRYRPLRDGAGPSSVGRYRPSNRWLTPLAPLGEAWKVEARRQALGTRLERTASETLTTREALKDCPF